MAAIYPNGLLKVRGGENNFARKYCAQFFARERAPYLSPGETKPLGLQWSKGSSFLSSGLQDEPSKLRDAAIQGDLAGRTQVICGSKDCFLFVNDIEYEDGSPTRDRYGRTLAYVYLEDAGRS